MEVLLASLIILNITQFGLLWYRMGRIEGTLREQCKQNKEAKHA